MCSCFTAMWLQLQFALGRTHRSGDWPRPHHQSKSWWWWWWWRRYEKLNERFGFSSFVATIFLIEFTLLHHDLMSNKKNLLKTYKLWNVTVTTTAYYSKCCCFFLWSRKTTTLNFFATFKPLLFWYESWWCERFYF